MKGALSAALLKRLLKSYIRGGALQVIDHSGRTIVAGDGSGPALTLRFKNAAIARKLVLNPAPHLPEGYMNGEIEIEGGSIYDFLLLLKTSRGSGKKPGAERRNKALQKLVRRLFQFNPAPVASRNARHHYDLNADMYRLFLDADMQYSCGYFEQESDSLETAQAAKKRHIAAKLCIEPGMRVLDIGCGWGGMAIYLARECHAEVVGITLSPEQRRIAEARALEAGVAGRVSFLEQDYRAVEGPFDRIVSVGMFEHVGVAHYATFFQKIRELLTDDGIALLHTIARRNGPSATNAFIRKYIFPGGYSPAISEIIPRIEKTRMFINDLEVWRDHYGHTCRHWRQRFAANRDRAAALYDDRFCRMWEFYLATSELTFMQGSHIVTQIQLSKSRRAVPRTRNYIEAWERRHPIAG
jgi:cyclopropane-fatty-acyl-phospholipid synthase